MTTQATASALDVLEQSGVYLTCPFCRRLYHADQVLNQPNYVPIPGDIYHRGRLQGDPETGSDPCPHVVYALVTEAYSTAAGSGTLDRHEWLRREDDALLDPDPVANRLAELLTGQPLAETDVPRCAVVRFQCGERLAGAIYHPDPAAFLAEMMGR